jgi:23S rRNA (cytidine1920-2'-O)/16S rRNA (cytidine1409-2'-O)-methyltransferase
VEKGLFASRSRAQDAVKRGTVSVNGVIAQKPGQEVAADAALDLDDPAARWVSRAALKLLAGLEAFPLSPEGCHCLDVGASTGGFTQVLLEHGAGHVTAIDVGHGQLHVSLAADPRVTAIEGLNARDLTRDHLAEAPGFVVADVSFISLLLALPPALDLAAPGAGGIFLVKPQFEVGREQIGKGGLVKPGPYVEAAILRVETMLTDAGWQVLGRIASPITGGDGNTEYVLGARKAPR